MKNGDGRNRHSARAHDRVYVVLHSQTAILLRLRVHGGRAVTKWRSGYARQDTVY